MKNLTDLEKKVNLELNTKINFSRLKHEHLYLNINSENLIDVAIFLKTNKERNLNN